MTEFFFLLGALSVGVSIFGVFGAAHLEGISKASRPKMVYVIDGKAHAGHKPQGDEYVREPTKFELGGAALDFEASDLHLYVCAACPWAHRVLMTVNQSSTLRSKVRVSVVSPFRDDAVGWEFLNDENRDRVARFSGLPVTCDASPLHAKTLLEVYLAACPTYTGNITTPTLYDAKRNAILSNDSFELMRAFAAAVPDELGRLYPPDAAAEAIEAEARRNDRDLGKRVYMCGLAKTQAACDAGAHASCLDWCLECFHERTVTRHARGRLFESLSRRMSGDLSESSRNLRDVRAGRRAGTKAPSPSLKQRWIASRVSSAVGAFSSASP